MWSCVMMVRTCVSALCMCVRSPQLHDLKKAYLLPPRMDGERYLLHHSNAVDVGVGRPGGRSRTTANPM